jgi:hypothetical protein
LGIESKQDSLSVPHELKFFQNKKLKEIVCGNNFTFAICGNFISFISLKKIKFLVGDVMTMGNLEMAIKMTDILQQKLNSLKKRKLFKFLVEIFIV